MIKWYLHTENTYLQDLSISISILGFVFKTVRPVSEGRVLSTGVQEHSIRHSLHDMARTAVPSCL